MEWYENDELFFEQCTRGHQWEQQVGRFLHLQGLDVEVQEQTLRDTIEEAHRYRNTIDIICEGFLIEIKSRDVVFHTPRDFPYDTILVHTVPGWESKDPKPHLILCVSQRTGAIIGLSGSDGSKAHWQAVRRFDNVRKIYTTFYEAPRSLWRPVEDIVKALRLAKADKAKEASCDPPIPEV